MAIISRRGGRPHQPETFRGSHFIDVETHGLEELDRDLEHIGEHYPSAMRKANAQLAKSMESEAKGRAGRSYPTIRGRITHPGHALASSITTTVGAEFIRLTMGGPAYPYAAGFEFGSRRYGQFPRTRRGGYILYPTVGRHAKTIRKRYLELVDDIFDTGGPEFLFFGTSGGAGGVQGFTAG